MNSEITYLIQKHKTDTLTKQRMRPKKHIHYGRPDLDQLM